MAKVISQLQDFWYNAKYVAIPLGCFGFMGTFIFCVIAGNVIIEKQGQCPVIYEGCTASYYLGKQQGFMGPYTDCLRRASGIEKDQGTDQ